MKAAASSVAVLLASLLAVHAALAHAEPVRVRPGVGAVVVRPPTGVEIEMTQEMARREGANDIDVFDESGREVTVIAAVIDNANRRRLTVPLPASLAPGQYSVRWKTLSADDGDSASGSYSFTFDPRGVSSTGREVVREDPLGDPTTQPELDALAPSEGGTSWVLVVAVACAALVLGSGGTWLFVQKRP